MTIDNQVSIPANIRMWANDGTTIPDWVSKHIVESLAPNGTFVLSTHIGNMRVHRGNVIIEHGGEMWARNPIDVPMFVKGLNEKDALNMAAIGPGKSAQFGVRSTSSTRKKRGGARKMAWRSPAGSMPSIEWVHTSELSVDRSYQRPIDNEGSRRLISSIAVHFDWRLFMPLVVSRRVDGSKIIIDGQHRWSAAVRRGDLPQLPCCIFTYNSPEDEARMFIVANRARKPMNRLDDFHAALAAADEDASEILRLVTEAGLTVARNTSSSAWKPGEVAFTSSIATALRRHGNAIVSAALTCLAEAFDGKSLIQGASIFGALIRLFANPPEGFDPDKLVPALQGFNTVSLGEIIRAQEGGDARTTAVYMAIVGTLSSRPFTSLTT